jgi:hypothetical protein
MSNTTTVKSSEVVLHLQTQVMTLAEKVSEMTTMLTSLSSKLTSSTDNVSPLHVQFELILQNIDNKLGALANGAAKVVKSAPVKAAVKETTVLVAPAPTVDIWASSQYVNDSTFSTTHFTQEELTAASADSSVKNKKSQAAKSAAMFTFLWNHANEQTKTNVTNLYNAAVAESATSASVEAAASTEAAVPATVGETAAAPVKAKAPAKPKTATKPKVDVPSVEATPALEAAEATPALEAAEANVGQDLSLTNAEPKAKGKGKGKGKGKTD